MRYAFVLLFLILVVPTSSALAQMSGNLVYGDQGLSIDLEPAYPSPGQNFTARANDYSLPIQGLGLSWVVDGKVFTAGTDSRTITLTAKEAGEATTIELIVDLPNGAKVRATKTVIPAYLDIIIEPQTRTPAFYRGRALPSIGGTINATAIINGGSVPSSNLIYTWRLNNETLDGGAIRANSSISFIMPRGEFATLSLEVRNPDGSTLARRIFTLRNVSPLLSFYEVSPLYGLSTKAVGETLTLLSPGLTLRAEPYYLDLATYNNPDFLEWQIDNVTSQNPGNNPYEVTVAQSGLGGSSQIEFHVRNTVQVLQGARGGFQLKY